VIWQLPHEQCVDHAENPGGGADAGRQDADRQQRKPGTAQQQPRTMLEIVDHVGVERELPTEPGRVVERSEHAPKHVELLFGRQTMMRRQPLAAGLQLGLPFRQPLVAIARRHDLREQPQHCERQTEDHAGFTRRAMNAPRPAMARNRVRASASRRWPAAVNS
jgi:hypothetical protein